ncbi:hypothetical protein DIPPA_32813 [Diplonema papillatum]|nr:hypothetical protein DIPPA_32813 [Diplonema papillatum]
MQKELLVVRRLTKGREAYEAWRYLRALGVDRRQPRRRVVCALLRQLASADKGDEATVQVAQYAFKAHVFRLQIEAPKLPFEDIAPPVPRGVLDEGLYSGDEAGLQGMVRQCSLHEVASLCFAAARFDGVVTGSQRLALFREVERLVLAADEAQKTNGHHPAGNLRQLPAVLADIVWSSAEIKFSSTALCECLLQNDSSLRSPAKRDQQNLVDSQVRALWGFAELRLKSEAVAEGVVLSMRRSGAAFKPRDVAAVVWAFAVSRYANTTECLRTVNEACSLTKVSSDEAVRILWAYAETSVPQPTAQRTLLVRAVLDAGDAETAVSALWACSSMRAPSESLGGLAGLLASKAQLLSLRSFGTILLSCHRMRLSALPDTVAREIVTRATGQPGSHPPELRASECLSTLQQMASLRYHHPELIDVLLAPFSSNRSDSRLDLNDAVSLLDSLVTLHFVEVHLFRKMTTMLSSQQNVMQLGLGRLTVVLRSTSVAGLPATPFAQWMLQSGILQTASPPELDALAQAVSTLPATDPEIVRLKKELADKRFQARDGVRFT